MSQELLLEKCNAEGHPRLSSIRVEEMAAAVGRAMSGQDGVGAITVMP